MPFKYFGKINYTPYTKVSKFADELQKGKLVGSKCKNCGTVIHSAPTGFEDMTPYTLGLVDLDGGGRLLSWFENTKDKDIKIGMKVKVVPKIFEEIEEIKLYYALEKK
ncbi:MAG: hypothetical protein AYK23_01030 [Candidatus Proteinoplasmatales archaeon SG8-5]|nr:MAG: hypothetical protein AYK23_01030 [Candidatus Proteinoplasmatales archaeon SG8-5]